MRLKALIAYDGTSYYGWQIQPRLPTIQSALEEALQKICRKETRVTGAGRTDSGVHATGQVAHFDWTHHLPPDKLLLALNGILPIDIRIYSIEETEADFHARFDARSKTYVYRIDRNRVARPFRRLYSLHFPFPLDPAFLQECARTIAGEHDFAAFQATGTEIVQTRRKIFNVHLTESAENMLFVRIHSTGFLRKMVRFLVGTMLEIASGKRQVTDLHNALQTGERRFVGVPAPARGLFLETVLYE